MVEKSRAIRMYSQQKKYLHEKINNEGTCFSKKSYIAKKYGESSPVFLSAYEWLADELEKMMPKPPEAELPYWCFADPFYIEKGQDSDVLVLDVPIDELFLFTREKWTKVLKLQYIGTESEVKTFRTQLKERGIKQESDVMLTNFYPELKTQIKASWATLLKDDNLLKKETEGQHPVIQGAVWQMKKEWIVEEVVTNSTDNEV